MAGLPKAMRRKAGAPGRDWDRDPSCFDILGQKLNELFERLTETEEPRNSYIDNPDSHYHYAGRNPFRLLAKAVLILEHRFTSLPEEPGREDGQKEA